MATTSAINKKAAIKAVPKRSAAPGYSRVWLLALFVCALTFAVYFFDLPRKFVDYDDSVTVVDNLQVHELSLHSIRWMFTAFHAGYWIPMTWLSHAIDYQLWGLNAYKYHLMNLFLHTINTLLVFFLCFKITNEAVDPSKDSATRLAICRTAAAIAAILFGLHPLHVESVAWVTERKDVLYAFFFLLSLFAYLNYGKATKRKFLWLGICFFTFVASVMSKPMAISLPVVLVLLDAWPLRRLGASYRSLVVEKLPFFTFSAIAGLMVLKSQGEKGAVAAQQLISSVPASHNGGASRLILLLDQALNACEAILFHLQKTIWPSALIVEYPILNRSHELVTLPHVLGVLAILIIFFACYRLRKYPQIAVAWLFFLITLFPSFGVLPAVANRFTYLPGISLLLLLGIGISLLEAKFAPSLLKSQWSAVVFTSILAVSLTPLTLRQIETWKSSQALWTNEVHFYPDKHVFNRLAWSDLESGETDRAFGEYSPSVANGPDNARFYATISASYQAQSRLRDALSAAMKAVYFDPTFADAYNALGVCYGRTGQAQESERALEKAVSLAPGNAAYLANLANTYLNSGKLAESVELFKKAQQLNRSEPRYFIGLGNAFVRQELYQQAMIEFQDAARLAPYDPAPHVRLAEVYETTGNATQSFQEYSIALRLGAQLEPSVLRRLTTQPQTSR